MSASYMSRLQETVGILFVFAYLLGFLSFLKQCVGKVRTTRKQQDARGVLRTARAHNALTSTRHAAAYRPVHH